MGWDGMAALAVESFGFAAISKFLGWVLSLIAIVVQLSNRIALQLPFCGQLGCHAEWWLCMPSAAARPILNEFWQV